MKNYYYILGISSDASLEEIKAAYKKLSKKFHPDVNGNDKFFEERFREILEAYEILNNSQKRTAYDSKLKSHLNSFGTKNASNEKSSQTTSSTNAKYNTQKDTKQNTTSGSKKPTNKNESQSAVVIFIGSLLGIGLMVGIVTNNSSRSSNADIKYERPITALDTTPINMVNSWNIDTPASIDTVSSDTLMRSSDSMVYSEPTKSETISWIVSKLVALTPKQYYDNGYYFINHFYYIGDTNLIVEFYKRSDEENFKKTRYELPIYAIRFVRRYQNKLLIGTQLDKIKEYYDHSDEPKYISSIEVELYFNREDSLEERFVRAFNHLKKFYSAPPKDIF